MEAHRDKSPNGQAQGGSYLLVFNLDDEGQAKAWQIAQELAGQRKLKYVLVGLLLAVYTVKQQTGSLPDLLQFMASFITGLVSGGGEYRPLVNGDMPPEDLPNMFAGTDDHANPLDARENFSAGMGNLFDDEDELWD